MATVFTRSCRGLYTARARSAGHRTCDCSKSIAVMFELRCSEFELFCSETMLPVAFRNAYIFIRRGGGYYRRPERWSNG